MTCTVTRGKHRCDKPADHVGEHECVPPDYPDAQRELSRAARRIVELEDVVRGLVGMTCCRGRIYGSCDCCLRLRSILREVLG